MRPCLAVSILYGCVLKSMSSLISYHNSSYSVTARAVYYSKHVNVTNLAEYFFASSITSIVDNNVTELFALGSSVHGCVILF